MQAIKTAGIRIRQEARKAFIAGECPMKHCPYEKKLERKQWRKGWEQARTLLDIKQREVKQ